MIRQCESIRIDFPITTLKFTLKFSLRIQRVCDRTTGGRCVRRWLLKDRPTDCAVVHVTRDEIWHLSRTDIQVTCITMKAVVRQPTGWVDVQGCRDDRPSTNSPTRLLTVGLLSAECHGRCFFALACRIMKWKFVAAVAKFVRERC